MQETEFIFLGGKRYIKQVYSKLIPYLIEGMLQIEKAPLFATHSSILSAVLQASLLFCSLFS